MNNNQNKRECSCDDIDDEYRRENRITDGFCGICEDCGKPAHTQRFPGYEPRYGAWCDGCFKMVAEGEKRKSFLLTIAYFAVLAFIIGSVLWVTVFN